ncbi:TPA: DNA-binding protein [Salmonella enterica]|uniref:DNA-binding protein n=1 Tax=Salmonella enterica TaxID=28901 RepID=A0A756L907_SALER|nr:DNA-binding protein [Salmonella enterica]
MPKVLNVPDDVPTPGFLPLEYPYRDKDGNPVLEESLSDYARRTGKTLCAIQWHADRGNIPISQKKKNAHRKVNLYAIFLKAVREAQRYADDEYGY